MNNYEELIKLDPTTPQVLDIVGRLEGLPEDAQVAADLMIVTLTICHSLGLEESSIMALVMSASPIAERVAAQLARQ
jgi:hypothetical protein